MVEVRPQIQLAINVICLDHKFDFIDTSRNKETFGILGGLKQRISSMEGGSNANVNNIIRSCAAS